MSAARLKHFGWGREGEGLTAEEEAFVMARAEARFGTALKESASAPIGSIRRECVDHGSSMRRLRFPKDIQAFEKLRNSLQPIIEKVWHHCERTKTCGRTVTLKVKFADFEQITRRYTVAETIANQTHLRGIALDLLATLAPLKKRVRLLGVTLPSLRTEEASENSQMSLEL